MFDVDTAIEEIANKVHQGWMQQKLAHGFADHPYCFMQCPNVPEHALVGVCRTCYERGDSYYYDNAGWQTREKYHKQKHHSDMLPYSALPDNIKDYDRRTARVVFDWLDENDWQIVTKEIVI
jgi:hypothetical protein